MQHRRLLKAIEAYKHFSSDMDSEVFKVAEEILVQEMKNFKNQGPTGSNEIPEQPKGLNGPNQTPCNYSESEWVYIMDNIR